MSNDYTFWNFRLRADMVEALEAYVNEGRPLGDFLYAAITNNFMAAVGCADEDNQRNLPALAGYIYNEIPSSCHGSPEAYKAWLERFGVTA